MILQPNSRVALVLLLTILSACDFKPDTDLERGIIELKKGNTPTAIDLLSASHRRGNRKATKHLFRIYAIGIGVPSDFRRAKELLDEMTHRGAMEEIETAIVALDEGHYSGANKAEADRWRDVLRAMNDSK